MHKNLIKPEAGEQMPTRLHRQK